MDAEQIKALSVLGYHFGLHLLRSLRPGKKPDAAALFRSYFQEDRITSFTAAEHAAVLTFEHCLACGLCPAHCRVMELSAGEFLGPLHLAIAASRSQPDIVHDLDSLLLCAVCGQCEPVCPQRVPIADIIRFMRAMLWRVAAERLPPAYHEARENLLRHGNLLGPRPNPDLPENKNAGGAVVFGPALSRKPELCGRLFRLLSLLGDDLTAVEEAELAGAEDLGLFPDTAWVDRLARRPVHTVIVADPASFVRLRREPRLAAKRVKFLAEAIVEKWPEGRSLSGLVKGLPVLHLPVPLARGGYSDMEQTMGRTGLSFRSWPLSGEDTPAIGWEGGISLVAPQLAEKLSRARVEDAVSVGASAVIVLSWEDFERLSGSAEERGLQVFYFPELAAEALG